MPIPFSDDSSDDDSSESEDYDYGDDGDSSGPSTTAVSSSMTAVAMGISSAISGSTSTPPSEEQVIKEIDNSMKLLRSKEFLSQIVSDYQDSETTETNLPQATTTTYTSSDGKVKLVFYYNSDSDYGRYTITFSSYSYGGITLSGTLTQTFTYTSSSSTSSYTSKYTGSLSISGSYGSFSMTWNYNYNYQSGSLSCSGYLYAGGTYYYLSSNCGSIYTSPGLETANKSETASGAIISIWTSCEDCSNLEVKINGKTKALLTGYTDSEPTCGQETNKAISSLEVASGDYKIGGIDEKGNSWPEKNISVLPGECFLFELR
ncbi:hypothetical protein KJ966_07360 [bacterium]|nr:hypothetical protein [bacterium]